MEPGLIIFVILLIAGFAAYAVYGIQEDRVSIAAEDEAGDADTTLNRLFDGREQVLVNVGRDTLLRPDVVLAGANERGYTLTSTETATHHQAMVFTRKP